MPSAQKMAGHDGHVSRSDFMKMLDVAWFAKEANPSGVMAVQEYKPFHQYQNLSVCQASLWFFPFLLLHGFPAGFPGASLSVGATWLARQSTAPRWFA